MKFFKGKILMEQILGLQVVEIAPQVPKSLICNFGGLVHFTFKLPRLGRGLHKLPVQHIIFLGLFSGILEEA